MTLETNEAYKIELPFFEGPLDLLLHLIRKNDFEIQDIPISRILNQYIDYLNLARELNIDLAGEFLEMAAELTLIKSRMLLPEPPAEEETGNDPRADLVAKLLEYQRYKRAASLLISRPLLGRDVFRRSAPEAQVEAQEETIEVDSLVLLSAFQEILKKIPKDQHHEVRNDRIGVAERIMELIEELRGKKELLFEALFHGARTRSEIVTTFLALLEMGRQKLIRIIQQGSGPLVVSPLFSEGE